MRRDGPYARIYARVRRVPKGRVITYGEVARTVGGCTARQVGYAMAALPEGSDVPWHRVVNSRGEISTRSRDADGALVQRILLEREGVRFGPGGKLDLSRWGWRTRGDAARPSRRRRPAKKPLTASRARPARRRGRPRSS
jgi:methylated-DNA-protein-cysteine methyltransferase-like protein